MLKEHNITEEETLTDSKLLIERFQDLSSRVKTLENTIGQLEYTISLLRAAKEMNRFSDANYDSKNTIATGYPEFDESKAKIV